MSKLIQLNNTISESFIESIKDSDINVYTDEFFEGNYKIYINSECVFLTEANNVYKISGSNVKSNALLRVYVDPKTNSKFNFYISIGSYNNPIEVYKCVYTPTYINISNNSKTSKILNTDHSSFMLMRTNPKLTGNIKLVVNENNEMFLDTFKINKELSDKKYRKIKVSGNSYYSNDVRNVFNELPSTSLYGIPDLGDNIFDVKKDIKSQYIDVYNYGVKTNTDKLYRENFSFFAPLWINKILPDFFVIFRVNDFKNNKSINATDRMKYCIEHGSVVKSYDLRRNSPIGNYLRNIQSEITNYLSSAYISYNDYDYNSWHGISIDSGIITTANETTYDYKYINNQVQFDNFITMGYERNRLLNPYIVNFEFMFNDNESDNYKINQYVGFYLSNNEYNSIYNINDDNFNYVNVNDNLVNDNINLFNDDILKTRIFNITHDVSIFNNFYRFDSNEELFNILNNDSLKNIPYKNILSAKIADKFNNEFHPQFLTITINKPLNTGEHLRIIDSNNNHIFSVDKSVSDSSLIIGAVYDVIAGRVDNSYKTYDEYFNINSEEIINYEKYNEKYVIVHHNVFGGKSDHINIDDNDVIKIQIEQIVDAFNMMTDKPFKISTYSNNSITFMALDPNNILKFERISSEIIYDIDKNDIIDIDDIEKDVTYFNNFIIPSALLKIENNFSGDDVLYLPNSFEIWNNRYAYIVDFVNYNIKNNQTNQITTKNCWSYTISKNAIDKIDRFSLVKNSNDEYVLLGNFNILYYTFENNKFISNTYDESPTNMLISPLSHDAYILQIPGDNEAALTNNVIDIYSIAPLQFSIAGFMPIKDFNFNVLDKTSKINNNFIKNSDTLYSESYNDNIYTKLNITKGSIVNVNPNVVYKVISGNVKDINGNEYASGDIISLGVDKIICANNNDAIISVYSISEENDLIIDSIERNDKSFENILNYFNLKDNDDTINILDSSILYEKYINKSKSQVPLISPINCKWNINGTDIFGNKIKEIHNNDALTGNSIYLDSSIFGYSSYKYLTSNDKSLYVYNDIHDIVEFNGKTLKENILNKTLSIVDIFNNDNTSLKNKFSNVIYNKEINALETIFSGKKIILSNTSNNILIDKYNNYLFTIICSPSNSDNDFEIFIDEELEIIMCIWYQKNGNGSYTYKNNYIIDNIYDENNKSYGEHPFVKLNNNVDLRNIINTDYIPINKKINVSGGKLFLVDQYDISTKSTYINTSNTYNIVGLSDNNINDYAIDITDDVSIFKSYTNYVYNIDSNLIMPDTYINDSSKLISKSNNNIYEYLVDVTNFSYDFDYKDISNLNNVLYLIKDSKRYYNSLNIVFEDAKINNNNVKSYSTYSNPEFVDIITFDNNEISDIINTTKKNFISSNTVISNVNNIKQLWHNKISDEPRKYYIDISTNNISDISTNIISDIGIDVEYDFNITQTMWDSNMIKKYKYNSDVISKYPGYYLCDDLKMFFGSTALVIDDDNIDISVWPEIVSKRQNKKYNNSADEIVKYSVRVNISSGLINYFMNNQTFISNWPNNSYDYIYNYINNVIFNYFIINNKNNIKVYKTYNPNALDNKVINYNSNLSYEEVNNIKIELIEENDVYYLDAELPNDDYQYAFVYKLTK